MTKEEMVNLLRDFLRFAHQQYNSQLMEFDIGTRDYELTLSDEIIDHFLEGDEQ